MATLRRKYAFAAVLTLLAVSPTPAEGFWKKDKSSGNSESASVGNDNNGIAADHVPVEYGVDVSFPIHYNAVSDNYAWLPHNLDPEHNEVPPEHKDKVVQPLGDRQLFYDDFLEGCKEKWGDKGRRRCQSNEDDRIAMSLRQPQSMQVSGYELLHPEPCAHC